MIQKCSYCRKDNVDIQIRKFPVKGYDGKIYEGYLVCKKCLIKYSHMIAPHPAWDSLEKVPPGVIWSHTVRDVVEPMIRFY